jgi:probable addiction module antidote protein
MTEALASGDTGYIAHALGVVARARGMAQIAAETGLSREQLYRSFSENGNPTLKTTLAVMKALGIELTARAPVHTTV